MVDDRGGEAADVHVHTARLDRREDVVAVVAVGADRITTATVAWTKERFDEWWNEAREASAIDGTLSDATYTLPLLSAAACVAVW